MKGRFRNELQRVRAALAKRVNAKGEKRVSRFGGGAAGRDHLPAPRAAAPNSSLLEAELLTGRTHQIRVHLAHLGHPVLGDDKYGDFELNKALRKHGLKRMFLHARALAFAHPVTGEQVRLEAALPRDLEAFRRAHIDEDSASDPEREVPGATP